MSTIIYKFLYIIQQRKTNLIIECVKKVINNDEKILEYGICNDTIITLISIYISFLLYAIFCGLWGTKKFEDIVIIFIIFLFVLLVVLLNYILNIKLNEIIILTNKSIIVTSKKYIKQNYIKEQIYFSEIISVEYSPLIIDTLTINLKNKSEKSFDNLTNLKKISQYFNNEH
jgi:hypothetical protein